MSEYEYRTAREKRQFAMWITLSILILISVIVLLMAVMPRYRVWSQEMRGRAAFAEAEQNRKIQVEEAKANLEAQKLNSESEIVRAEGMAKAIEIENGKLTEKYIQYLWVRNMENNTNEKIYIPTEANLPILEAKK